MAEQRGSRKLTRIDVLIAAVSCLLLIVLVSVLFAAPRERSIRKVCAANLAQIGKAMLLYADDYEGALPRAGGPDTVWDRMLGNGWMAASRRTAFGLAEDDAGGKASVSSSLYLLIKHVQVSPRLFICKGDQGTTEFTLSSFTLWPSFDLSDAWDFGPPTESFKHCSYAYHVPYGKYSLSTSMDPNLAVAADRNPWIASPASSAGVWSDFRPDIPSVGAAVGTSATARTGNSISHRQDGQNVLFLDGRVAFEKRAYCGVDKDNIYTVSRDPSGGDPYGMGMVASGYPLMNRKDSLLVHDPPLYERERR